MATFNELQHDWSTLCRESPECWTDSDLQLAAELGKTLLERNKELENSIKHQQNIIEDQTQEIEYLTKQTVALREVNDSRLRIYEQLEVNIQDLERANHRLAVDNASDKKHIKSLTANIEALELKCEQLQGNIDDLSLQLEMARRKSQRLSATPGASIGGYARKRGEKLQQLDEVDSNGPVSPDSSCTHRKNDECVSTKKSDRCQETQTTPKREDSDSVELDNREIEQIAYLMGQVREAHTQCAKEQRRITELEEHLEILQEQNKILERQLSQYHTKEEEVKSMQDEICSLEEVRQGQLCGRCLRTINGDDMSISADDDSSMFEAITEQSQHRSSFSMEVQDYTKTSTPTKQGGNNLYKDLVQKYEALLEVHRHPTRSQKQGNNCLSLHEELQMSNDFNNLNTKDTDEESGHGDSLKTETQAKTDRKTFSRTPTDFSEAETSSSGFSDETSNKATQTDGRPGSFLCTIADGKDCISIYDDASPIESRFRNSPEYRELFREIFSVLKKTAVSKEDNEDLPRLDDKIPQKNAPPKVPPVTPCNDTFPEFPDNATDDTQSILSSTMSQSSSQLEVTISENVEEQTVQKDAPPPAVKKLKAEEKREAKTKEISLTPLVRQPLEYVSVAVNVRKRSQSRRKKAYNERSDSPVTHIVGSPKVTYSNRHNGRRTKENRPTDPWVGNTKIFYNRTMQSPTPSQDKNSEGYRYEHALEYKPSQASQELYRLKTLERTYADVLRKSDKPIHWRKQN